MDVLEGGFPGGGAYFGRSSAGLRRTKNQQPYAFQWKKTDVLSPLTGRTARSFCIDIEPRLMVVVKPTEVQLFNFLMKHTALETSKAHCCTHPSGSERLSGLVAMVMKGGLANE